MKEKKINLNKLGFWSLIIVVVLWGVNLIFLIVLEDNDTIGSYGDVFGIVNSLFSGLAFAGIILTIYMQREELKLQRKELKKTKKVFKKQNSLMNDQKTDSVFFNLLSNHRQLVDSFKTGETKFLNNSSRYSLGGTGSIQEEVSGYKVLQKVVNKWHMDFTEFTLSYGSKLLVKEYVGMENGFLKQIKWRERFCHPHILIEDDRIVDSLYQNIMHLYAFVQERFKNEEVSFYRDILVNNLTFEEKFIFEVIFFNFPEKRGSLNYKTEEYEKQRYADFRTIRLPKLDYSILSRNSTIRLQSDYNITSVITMSYQEEDYYEGRDCSQLSDVYVTELNLPRKEFESKYEDIIDPIYTKFNKTHRSVYRKLSFALIVNLDVSGIEYRYIFKINSKVNDIDEEKSCLKFENIELYTRENAEEIIKLLDK